MLVTEDSANVLGSPLEQGRLLSNYAIWRSVVWSVPLFSDLPCASGGIFSGLNGNGASYWEASNFDNTAQAGCAVFVQTGQIGEWLRRHLQALRNPHLTATSSGMGYWLAVTPHRPS